MQPHPGTENRKLSPRMLQALAGVAQGKSRSQIAREMEISPHTLKGYLGKAFERLGAHNAPEAISKAMRLEILDG